MSKPIQWSTYRRKPSSTMSSRHLQAKQGGFCHCPSPFGLVGQDYSLCERAFCDRNSQTRSAPNQNDCLLLECADPSCLLPAQAALQNNPLSLDSAGHCSDKGKEWFQGCCPGLWSTMTSLKMRRTVICVLVSHGVSLGKTPRIV